jgi:2,4-dichlorophenol 6-monooxygenase
MAVVHNIEGKNMADITIDVMIIGTGPAGGTAAALLASYGINTLIINRYRWLANTPRAHITNQRTMEVLRDLGKEVEAEAYIHATDQDLMGENVFCVSLAGEELGRMKSWGKSPASRAEHMLSSPTHMNDLPQTFMEPLLYKTACSRGAQSRMSCEYVSHEQDKDGVTVTVRDRLTEKNFTVRCKYLVGADGGNSLVAEHAGLPFDGKMGLGGSINILFRADLSKYVAHRPSVLYWVMQPGADVGGIGMGVVRMVRPWNEWLIIWGYDISQPAPKVDAAMATQVARQLVGDPHLEIDLISASTWTVNNMYATHMQKDRVFIMGDAAHRHPPSNGLGSNTSMQDAFNLSWKLAAVIKRQATPKLLETYSQERAPIAKQIVTRANQSIGEFGPIFEALGMDGGVDHEKIQRNMDGRCDSGEKTEKQREALRKAIAFKKYEFDCHGVEMNQRYVSPAVIPDGMTSPGEGIDMELHYVPTTSPGARIPHAWVYDKAGGKHSMLDLTGKGVFTLVTGIGGEAWVKAAQAASEKFGITIATRVIGPRRDYEDHGGEWANAREISDSGCLLVRPDQHVAFRAQKISATSDKDISTALTRILGH